MFYILAGGIEFRLPAPQKIKYRKFRESGATFPTFLREFADKICAVLDFGDGVRITYYSEQYTPMSFLQADQVLPMKAQKSVCLVSWGKWG